MLTIFRGIQYSLKCLSVSVHVKREKDSHAGQ